MKMIVLSFARGTAVALCVSLLHRVHGQEVHWPTLFLTLTIVIFTDALFGREGR